MAGGLGFEPSHNGFRDRRATATLTPMAPALWLEQRYAGLEPAVLTIERHRNIHKAQFDI